MFDAAHIHPHPTREDAYFQVLEAFIRTSAGYLDVEYCLPEMGLPRQWHAHSAPVSTLR